MASLRIIKYEISILQINQSKCALLEIIARRHGMILFFRYVHLDSLLFCDYF